jgi:hypothetical protein
VRGWIDVLLRRRTAVVIDHKSRRDRGVNGNRRHCRIPDNWGYRRALIAAGECVAACAVHFPISGGARIRRGACSVRRAPAFFGVTAPR